MKILISGLTTLGDLETTLRGWGLRLHLHATATGAGSVSASISDADAVFGASSGDGPTIALAISAALEAYFSARGLFITEHT